MFQKRNLIDLEQSYFTTCLMINETTNTFNLMTLQQTKRFWTQNFTWNSLTLSQIRSDLSIDDLSIENKSAFSVFKSSNRLEKCYEN